MTAQRKPKPGDESNPITVDVDDAPEVEVAPAKAEPKTSGRELYVAVDSLSWRPHSLPKGTEVQDILPASVLEACLADGRVSRDKP